MDLLENAVESFRAGVQDYEQGDHGRLLSSVRSIHAGILLLYKEALRRLSPADSHEVLLKSRMLPTRDAQGNIHFVGDGSKTVDVQQIQERLESLNITTDWTRFKSITKTRNEIEHYYSKTSKKALEGLIADAFVIARDFITTHLKEDPLTLLGEETWQVMLDVSQVYDVERAECAQAIKSFDWQSAALRQGVLELTCRACGSDLIRPPDGETEFSDAMSLECRACGEERSAQDFVPAAIKSALAGEMYLSHTDGDESPYTNCPECGNETYVMDEECCALCGETAEHTCARCGNRIPAGELMCAPYCGYCDHMMAKDD